VTPIEPGGFGQELAGLTFQAFIAFHYFLTTQPARQRAAAEAAGRPS
jgi:hypothetical protein